MGTAGTHVLGRGLERLPALCAAACRLPDGVHRFYFLRHGQTARNALRIFQDLDEPLCEIGLAQAEAAAALLAEELRDELTDGGTVHIISSDLPRARTTAETVARRLACETRLHQGLRERHFGALIGNSSADIDWDCAPAGSETLDQFALRNLAALAEAVADPAPVIVVAHGGTLHVLAAALGLVLDARLLANARPLRLDRVGDAWAVTPLGADTAPVAAPNLA